MRCLAFIFLLAGACLAGALSGAGTARADILINVNKGAQRMTVTIDGKPRFNWAISSGLDGGPPSGTYRPERLERTWFSQKYDLSPMPHSIFFHYGYAIHGTNYVSRLGRRASHGCVRLHPNNAATLFALVQEYGKRRTKIVVTDGHYASR